MTNKLKSNLKQTLYGALVFFAMLPSCGKKEANGDGGKPQLTIELNDPNQKIKVKKGGTDEVSVPFSLKIGIDPVDEDKDIKSTIVLTSRKIELDEDFDFSIKDKRGNKVSEPSFKVLDGKVDASLILTIKESGRNIANAPIGGDTYTLNIIFQTGGALFLVKQSFDIEYVNP